MPKTVNAHYSVTIAAKAESLIIALYTSRHTASILERTADENEC